MIIDCLSDLHGHYPALDGGDLLILAGDYTGSDAINQWEAFFRWLEKLNYRKKVLVAGNHDGFCKNWAVSGTFTNDEYEQIYPGDKPPFEYLCDSGMEFEGVKIWGSPWTPFFDRVNPKCTAFMASEEELDEKFAMIPKGLDILITHGPMMYVLDGNKWGNPCGSHALRKHVDRAQPKNHIFGHIHERGGCQLLYKHQNAGNTWCSNCSYVDEHYEPVHKPIRITI